MKRLKILLSNDDGIYAPGLRTMWEALREADIADLMIIAPAHERSGAGCSITWDRPLLIEKIKWDDDTPVWAIDGSPADCIKMGLHTILKEMPDMILAGINAGSNAGRNVLHSGTIGAVIEGILHSVPGAALSCEDGDEPNYHIAKKYVRSIVEYMRDYPLPPGNFLNVNFPHQVEDKVKGFKITRQGKGRWVENPLLHLETKKGPTYFLGGKPDEVDEIDDCDIALLKQGFMTAVPLHVHELTLKEEVTARKEQFEKYFAEKHD